MAPETTDGRRLRSARNRELVLNAVLDIVNEQGGGPLPGAAQVARRARVSERTVFRHFADLDSLFLAASARQRPRLAAALEPRPSGRDLDARIAAVVRLRSGLYEETAPVRRVAVRLAAAHEVVAEQIEESHLAARAQLSEVFGRELRRLPAARRSLLLDELDLATDWSTWETLRSVQGCGPGRARRLVAEIMAAVLRPASRRRASPSLR